MPDQPSPSPDRKPPSDPAPSDAAPPGPTASEVTAPEVTASDATPPDAAPPAPVNRAERRGRRKDPGGGYRGSVGQSGPAHPGAQGRRVNPVRRSG